MLKLLLCAFLSFLSVLQATAQCPGEPSKESNPTIDSLIRDFTSDQWPRVWAAKLRLESRQAQSIPALLEILQSDRFVKLKNTWDLIYPGADTFYGHGYIVDYDLDWLSARAGWALEEMTFQQFGFEAKVIKHDELLQAVLAGKAAQQLKDVVKLPTVDPAAAQSRKRSVQAALQWWQQAGRNWTRLEAVADALKSKDEIRASRTLEWIRNGETRCDGFNRKSMAHIILPAALKYADSGDQTLRDQIRLLRAESKHEWLYKQKNEKSCY